MSFLEKFRNAGISDKDIIIAFNYKAGGSVKIGKRCYSFGGPNDSEKVIAELRFNKDGLLHNIIPGKLLSNDRAQQEFIESALQDINGDHGFMVTHRVLFSQKPLAGMFQWKDNFRIRPCLELNHIGKGLDWRIDMDLRGAHRHLGPPHPIILEVRTPRSPNFIIETNRYLEALDFYQWALGLLIPHIIGTPFSRSGLPKWISLKYKNEIQYHLAHEGFALNESEILETDNFSPLEIPNVPRYEGQEDYYNHFWFQRSEVELSNELERYLELIDNLPKDIKEDFRRALYWFDRGSGLGSQEEFSIIPFTIAIECLLPDPSNDICESCKKPKSDGPTKLFNDFLKEHLSLPNNIENLKKSIYPKRSRIVHGSYASAVDESFFSLVSDNSSGVLTEHFVRRSILNWLVTGNLG
jgi:hypothetical protein